MLPADVRYQYIYDEYEEKKKINGFSEQLKKDLESNFGIKSKVILSEKKKEGHYAIYLNPDYNNDSEKRVELTCTFHMPEFYRLIEKGEMEMDDRDLVMSLIGKEPRLIMDFELYKGSKDNSKKDEGELTVAKRLLSRVAKEHKHNIDAVVYDALACNSGWINHCTINKVIPVIHVIEAILYLMSIASNLMQLFIFRRLSGNKIKLLTQKEIVRLLEKELYLFKYNKKYIFDTT